MILVKLHVTDNGTSNIMMAFRQRKLFIYLFSFCAVSLLVLLSYSITKSRRSRTSSSADTVVEYYDGCDSECAKFRQLLAVGSWPPDKPRAAVVMLIGRSRPAADLQKDGVRPGTGMFAHFARDFDSNFNDLYGYPLIVFYESSSVDQTELDILRSATRSRVFFQPVAFEIPSFVNTSEPLERCANRTSQGIGYKHMCRFHAKTIYEQPIILSDRLEYVWRLDDDSFITRKVHYDPFRFIKDRGAVYGHVGTFYDNQCWTVELWDAVADYWKKLGVKQKCDWPPNLAHYNNFEISDLEVWNSIEYRRYIDHVDRLGGIYYYRWGDSSIKSLFLSYMYHPRLIYQFRNIGYRHNINRIS